MTTYESMPDTSRVWIYQSSRPFTEEELPKLKAQLGQFANSWVSHNNALKAFAEIYHQTFVVLMVDESQAGASGCSIDKSVHFMQTLGAHFGVDFFDRMNFAFQKNGNLQTAPREEFARLFAEGAINNQTPVFNNLIKTKGEFESSWVVPLEESWHKRFVSE